MKVVQKLILENVLKSERSTKIFGYALLLIWYGISVPNMLYLVTETSLDFRIGQLISEAFWLLVDLLTIYFTFEIREAVINLLRRIELDQKHQDRVLDNLYKMKGKAGRIVIFLGLSVFNIIMFLPSILIFNSSSLGSQINLIMLLIVWSLFFIFITDLAVGLIKAIFLPKTLLNFQVLHAPIPYHSDDNFGYLEIGKFSYKIYIFFLLYLSSYFILSLANPSGPSPTGGFTFTINYVVMAVWISANLLLLVGFYWSLHYYRGLILSAKKTEIDRIDKMIMEKTAGQDAEYWKISELIHLRDRIKNTNEIPVNTNILKKIIFSLLSTVATSILLPNILSLLQLSF